MKQLIVEPRGLSMTWGVSLITIDSGIPSKLVLWGSVMFQGTQIGNSLDDSMEKQHMKIIALSTWSQEFQLELAYMSKQNKKAPCK